ncbi:MAG: hypothetical protein GXO54_05135 [Chloroflexi bacterium]|nr:hypothetical protein [Chloroflexota bacterium]
MDFLQAFESMESWVERIAQRIPGYAGYKAREKRREADKLLRTTLAQRLKEQVQRLTDIQRRLLSSGGIRWLDEVETVITRLQAAADKIRTASYGYAGLFDAVKVNEAQLKRLYEFDAALVDVVERIARAIDDLEAALGTPDVGAILARVQRLAQDLLTTFEHRKDVLLQVDATSDEDVQTVEAAPPPSDEDVSPQDETSKDTASNAEDDEDSLEDA